MMDLRDITVPYFDNYYTTMPKEVNLWEYLHDDSFRDKVETIRRTSDSEKRKQLKAALPAICPSVQLSGERKLSNVIGMTGLLQFDVDSKENPSIHDFGELRNQISRLKEVAYCALSVSGQGVWGLVWIQYPERFKEHFAALSKAFLKANIKIDQACKDLTRLRGYSWDDDAYFAANPIVFTALETQSPSIYKELFKTIYSAPKPIFNKTPTMSKEEVMQRVMTCTTDITTGYQQWFEIGCSLANAWGEEGRQAFHHLSAFNESYDKETTDRQYDNCLKNDYRYSLGTLFHYLNQ